MTIENLADFTIATGKEATWQEFVDNSTDDYPHSILHFAARWAHILERDINVLCLIAGVEQPAQNGVEYETFVAQYIQEHAGEACSEADTIGITGGVEAMAVAILRQVWVYGAALDEWYRNQ